MKLISCADDCNIKVFMKCLFGNDLQALIVDEIPTPEQLELAWNEIWVEFMDLWNPEMPKLIKESQIQALDSSIQTINNCFIAINAGLTILTEINIDDDVLTVIKTTFPLLKENGVSLKWRNDLEDFKSQFRNEQTRYKTKYIQLKELKAELETITDEVTQPLTKDRFIKKINAVRGLLNLPIPFDTTSAAELAVMFNEYNELCARQNNN